MTEAARARIVEVPATRANGEPSLLHALIAEQQDLTAVERFARAPAPDAPKYRSLIPLTAPRPGEQYAFEVDLDRCTSCKACVTGCHTLNALDDGEVWRSVGLLLGGTPDAPALRTVTTACHHCVEPACMIGCPVKAYEKDPLTGIVKHLDDQCIGCQYCLFMCPYDAPKMNRARGIVRKCDLCGDRLARGEAPACAQACPTEAIRVTIVDAAQAVEAAQASAFIPGAPAPGMTLPTTNYRSERALPRNLLPADFYALDRAHSHPALVAMLVLTQVSVGAFAVDALQAAPLGRAGAWAMLAVGLVALAASVLHLGRPQYAWRALLGLRTSWLSREVLAFSLFAGLGGLYGIFPYVRLEQAVAASGALGVGCSVMVYAATGRAAWRAAITGFKFAAAAATCGCALVLLVGAIEGRAPSPSLARALAMASAAQLAFEAAIFRHLRSRRHTALKRSALLMMGDLSRATFFRFACGVIGGVIAPLCVTATGSIVLPSAIFALVLAGALLERYLFFAAATAPKMPGGPA